METFLLDPLVKSLVLAGSDLFVGEIGRLREERNVRTQPSNVFIDLHELGQNQCDQMVRLFFNMWPFATLKIIPMMAQIFLRRLVIFPNQKLTVKNLPNTFKLLSKWRNFVTSCYTDKMSDNFLKAA